MSIINSHRSLVSVVIPTFNRMRNVQKAIDSVLRQTYNKIEVLVVDDGSTDGTRLALSSFNASIRYLYQSNQGASAARNTGIRAARGDYVAFLDSDDVWLPGKLERQMHLLEADPNLGLVGCQAWVINNEGNVIDDLPIGFHVQPEHLLPEAILFANPYITSTVVVRKKWLEEGDPFDLCMVYGEDWDLWLRIAQLSSLGIVPEPLACICQNRNPEQWPARRYTPSRMLTDYQHMLNKVIIDNPGIFSDELLTDATASRYIWTALDEFAIGQQTESRQHLTQSWEMSPLAFETLFKSALVNYSLGFPEVGLGPDLADGLCYAERVLECLPYDSVKKRKLLHQRIIAELHVGFAFKCHRAMNRKATRQHLRNALCYDSSWFGNPGTLMILLESCGGCGSLSLLRRIKRLLLSSSTTDGPSASGPVTHVEG